MKTPAKKPAPRRRPPTPKPRPIPRVKRTPLERKSKAIELILVAISSGWTITRFAKHSHISRGALLRWLAEDTVQDRFIRAMQAKALALPDEASEIVSRMINGRRVLQRDDAGQPIVLADGSFAFAMEYLDPKAGRAALSHYEFRIMREIKAYQTRSHLAVTTDTSSLTDAQVDAKFSELMDRHQKATQATTGEAPGPEND